MRTVSLASVLFGLCLALTGCANEVDTDREDAPSDALSEEPATDTDGFETPASQIGITGMIPMPTKGRLYASTNRFDSCAWTVDGIGLGSSNVLDVSLFAGSHNVSCKRALDGHVASKTVMIVANQTTNADFPMPTINGEIVAVAVGGRCTFLLNGVQKATGSSVRLSVPPAVYSIGCQPTSGAPIITRSVIVKPAETPMAMFDLR
jgi:hypothetical protein